MHLPDKKWLFIIGLIIIIGLVLLCGIMLSKEKSVSNLYIIPAGVFSPVSGISSSHPALPSTNTTPARIEPTASPPINESSPVTIANAPSSAPGGRFTLDVLRGEPYTINGSVGNMPVTKVQVWLLDDTISTTIIPVMPDGTYQVILDSNKTAALSRIFSSVIVVQYPSPPDHFSVVPDTTTGDVIETETGQTTPLLSHLKDTDLYPTSQVDYLEQGIAAAGNSDTVYFINGVDALITVDPVSPCQPGSMVVRGNTSLPVGTPLSIWVGTVNFHPTTKNYDWSHEIAEGFAVVYSTTGGVNQYSGIINTTLLNTGKYFISVESHDDTHQAHADGNVEIIAILPANPRVGNYIDWSRLALPYLVVNESLTPVMPEGELRIVPPGTQATNNEVPYGSIIDCAPDGICRIFNQSGVQTLAVYNSNEARMMEVPNGAMIDSGTVGNVTFIKLNGDVILTKIDEYPQEP